VVLGRVGWAFMVPRVARLVDDELVERHKDGARP